VLDQFKGVAREHVNRPTCSALGKSRCLDGQYKNDAAAITYLLGSSPVPRRGDVWLRDKFDANKDTYSAAEGSSGYWLALHELGHALGLVHTQGKGALDS
jgi:hypothetical protein